MKNEKLCRYGGVYALAAALLAGCGKSDAPAAPPAIPVAAMTVATAP